MSKPFDDHVPMPRITDDYLVQILQPLCGKLTFACVDAAWEAVVAVLAVHAEFEALAMTRQAARR